MTVQTLEMKPVVSVAAVLRVVRSPLRIPAWSVVALVVLAALYAYVAGRQNPVHHYVPYVGYPLVLDTTTGKACYSTAPKPAEDASAAFNTSPADGPLTRTDVDLPAGPTIPLCGKG
jgi:hypothetical protein